MRSSPAILRVKLGDNLLREITWEDAEGEQRAKDWLWSTLLLAKLPDRFNPYDRIEVEMFL